MLVYQIISKLFNMYLRIYLYLDYINYYLTELFFVVDNST